MKESVWDYPRPPRLEPCSRYLKVVFADQIIAETHRGYRVLETSHPPTYYFPAEDVCTEFLKPASLKTLCEFKGQASYFDMEVNGRSAKQVAWCVPDPTSAFAAIRNYLSFYASRVDACFVDEEQVQPQAGDFYGGWFTSEIQGPFKGGPGTRGW
ncbi:MAG: DUF427 domain-containing protein [Candidatus Competibacteraceae bacterium]|jgi:uncharacterized protein (DUF427 family)|nr:DUF427 domain-containing protein [Candidatus Competibacteraceae bacterium]